MQFKAFWRDNFSDSSLHTFLNLEILGFLESHSGPIVALGFLYLTCMSSEMWKL